MTIESILGVDWERWPTLIGVLFIGVVVVAIAMWVAGRGMTRGGGASIVALELSSSKEQTEHIFSQWGDAGKRAAMRSLCLDYVWILLYTAALLLSALYVSEVADAAGWDFWALLLRIATVLSLAAGVLDMIENTVLLSQLATQPGELRTQISFIAASLKFALVGIVIVLVVALRSIGWLAGF